MKNAYTIVAWVCILSTLSAGCYSSVIVDPNREGEVKVKERIDPETIEYVVTKTNRRYVFDAPPAMVNDSIVGVEKIAVPYGYTTQQVSIPLSDVAEISVSEYSSWRTWGAIALVVGVVAVVIVGSTLGGSIGSSP